MKTIQLTQGKVTFVDDEDFKLLSKYKWCVRHKPNQRWWYATGWVNGKVVSMHRIIMGVIDPKIVVDHIDGDCLNNQRNNLRIATIGQNSCNRISRPGSSSKYLGVHWDKLLNKWQAKIRSNGKHHYLGIYENEKDAAVAYNKAAIIHHGEFANLNIV